MNATNGDWLIVESAHRRRRALIIEVRGGDGAPPYLVRWTDTGHEGLIFPGPNVRIEPAEHVANAG